MVSSKPGQVLGLVYSTVMCIHRMKDIPDSLKKILRDFCHVEWYETTELKEMVSDTSVEGERKKLFGEFKKQLSEAIEQAYISPESYESITGDECITNEEVVDRLKIIQYEVYGI